MCVEKGEASLPNLQAKHNVIIQLSTHEVLSCEERNWWKEEEEEEEYQFPRLPLVVDGAGVCLLQLVCCVRPAAHTRAQDARAECWRSPTHAALAMDTPGECCGGGSLHGSRLGDSLWPEWLIHPFGLSWWGKKYSSWLFADPQLGVGLVFVLVCTGLTERWGIANLTLIGYS